MSEKKPLRQCTFIWAIAVVCVTHAFDTLALVITSASANFKESSLVLAGTPHLTPLQPDTFPRGSFVHIGSGLVGAGQSPVRTVNGTGCGGTSAQALITGLQGQQGFLAIGTFVTFQAEH